VFVQRIDATSKTDDESLLKEAALALRIDYVGGLGKSFAWKTFLFLFMFLFYGLN
jgi:hypothetical protein